MALEEILKPGFVPAWWDLSKRTSILTRFPQLFSRRRGGVPTLFAPNKWFLLHHLISQPAIAAPFQTYTKRENRL